MDNLCHTLVGAAMGSAGLRRTTRFASATLMISANLPDLDVLVFATDAPSIAFRRGWTHGVLAQLVLPIALTGIVLLIGRLKPATTSEGPKPATTAAGDGRHPQTGGAAGFSRPSHPPLHVGWLLALSYLGLYSHVFLDFLNNYGIRLLTPFEWRWFYGDTLFIMDPWMWLTLGLGVWVSRWRRTPVPARVALSVAAIYVGGMLVSAQMARGIVADAWRAERGAAPRALMVGPAPIDPFAKQVIVDAGDRYETGSFTWLPSPRLTIAGTTIPKNADRPEVDAARRTPPFQAFLVWSRFPFFVLNEEPGGTRVSVGDMRFSLDNPLRDAIGRGRFTATVVVPRDDSARGEN
jgi:inner membrane protein